MDLVPDDATRALVALDRVLTRRRLLAAGGFSVAVAAVVAACAPDKPAPQIPQAGIGATVPNPPEQNITDAVLLRTASSLEHSEVSAYDRLIALGKLPAAAADEMKLYRDHHAQHASFFEAATRQAGGDAYTDPNPAVQTNIVEPALVALAKSGNKADDIIAFAYALEHVATGTYQSFVPGLSKPALRGQVMSVGAVEARHRASLAKRLPGATIAPPAAGAPVATTTSATAQGATTTAAAGEAPSSVYQVPGSFSPLTAVAVSIGGATMSIDLLGPNSYVYEDASQS
jgi:hypothetical protein